MKTYFFLQTLTKIILLPMCRKSLLKFWRENKLHERNWLKESASYLKVTQLLIL